MSNKQKVKKINSLFANRIVNEDSEIIQKSLVIAHEHYASREKYDDALKITKVISENLDKDGCFVLTANLRILWGFFSVPGKYNSKTY